MVTGAGCGAGGGTTCTAGAACEGWLASGCVASGAPCAADCDAGWAAGCDAFAGAAWAVLSTAVVTTGADGCPPGCVSAACCATALTLTSRAAVIIHFEVRMTLFSKLLLPGCNSPI